MVNNDKKFKKELKRRRIVIHKKKTGTTMPQISEKVKRYNYYRDLLHAAKINNSRTRKAVDYLLMKFPNAGQSFIMHFTENYNRYVIGYGILRLTFLVAVFTTGFIVFTSTLIEIIAEVNK